MPRHRVSFAATMSWKQTILGALAWLTPVLLSAASVTYEPGNVAPPPPAREFRAAWITTKDNIDWPSKPGLPVAQQKAELAALLDRAAQLHLNAVMFQVRSVSDAMYASSAEPWSEYITGIQGRAPEPYYDPLALAITEAHQRGLQLHAWFNPFRAADPESKSPPAPGHVRRTHPELIRRYGSQTWLDPGEPESQTRALNAILDVVKRYDVDGVVFDDYFYPYPEKNSGGREPDFPDDASWRKYGWKTGLTREDWRRENISRFVQNVAQSVKTAKPWVQFGISPFGIWRPGVPQGISPKALDAYGKLYADARLWLANGWLDYCAPQLYWPIAQRELSFPVLLQWWRAQNVKGRHVFAALNDAAVGQKFSADEIARQIQVVRGQTSLGGEIHYHLRSVTENPALAAAVRAQYAQPALMPPVSWLNLPPPDKPELYAATENSATSIRWNSSGQDPALWWLLQVCQRGAWTTEILPATQRSRLYQHSNPDAIVLRAVDRLGNLSEPAVLVPKKMSPEVPAPKVPTPIITTPTIPPPEKSPPAFSSAPNVKGAARLR